MSRLIRCCLCSTLVGLLVPATAAAAVFNVSNTRDAVAVSPASGCATAAGPPTSGACTLRSAVQAADAASGSSTINLGAGTYTLTIPSAAIESTPGDDGSSGDLEITNTTGTITIQGAGAKSTTIDANFLDRAIDTLPGTTLVLEGVTVRNGRPGAFGSGTSCPTASGRQLPGGGIDAGGTLALNDDVLTGNIALADGGAVSADGNVPLTVRSTIIHGNAACPHNSSGQGDGGGIAFEGGGPATIDSSTISGNSASGAEANGGGLAEEGDDAVTITDSSITGNSATGGGGGVLGEGGGSLSFTGDTISGNTAGGIGIVNFAAPGGGGVFNDGSDTDTYLNTTITGNQSSTDGGGILDNGGGSDTISFSTISGNRASAGTGNLSSVPFSGFLSRFVLKGSIVAGGVGAVSNCNSGAFTSNGYNLFSDSGASCGAVGSDLINRNPELGSLASNGGPTQTEALKRTSPAIDVIPKAVCPSADQRGLARPDSRETKCDVGAYEFQDLVAPHGTKITSSKIERHKRSATFKFTASGTVAGFQCSLVKTSKHHHAPKPRFRSCHSPKAYKHLAHGNYIFEVRAFNAAGPDPKPAVKKFKI